jgi:hypothetical protein
LSGRQDKSPKLSLHFQNKKSMLNTLINYLSWSEQRAQLFQVCQKQYGYRFLEAWGGWSPEASEASQYAYFCNSIVGDLRMITGSIVHDRCGRVLKRLASGIQSDLSRETTIAEEDFDKFLSDSFHSPLSALGGKRKKLLAHVYGDTISKAFVAAERKAIPIMLGHFFTLPEVRLFDPSYCFVISLRPKWGRRPMSSAYRPDW